MTIWTGMALAAQFFPTEIFTEEITITDCVWVKAFIAFEMVHVMMESGEKVLINNGASGSTSFDKPPTFVEPHLYYVHINI